MDVVELHNQTVEHFARLVAEVGRTNGRSRPRTRTGTSAGW